MLPTILVILGQCLPISDAHCIDDGIAAETNDPLLFDCDAADDWLAYRKRAYAPERIRRGTVVVTNRIGK
jgi:hypothetical protein